MSNMTGHHAVHAGLQNHSGGGMYPLAVVGYGNGDKLLYVLENLCTGKVLFNCNTQRVQSRRDADDINYWAVQAMHDNLPTHLIFVEGRPRFVDDYTLVL